MKTSNHAPLLSDTGLTEKTTFRIDANNAKLFDILQNSMYTDKILAPVRELICNAYDAHQQVKNDKPFLVFVPNSNVREWVVRDYGPGLSHEDIMTLYTTYMQSTKDQSDDMIGGFGIGSKSPFAYTDQFTVISYFNHKKTRYAAFIGSDGLPTISVVDQIDTLEDNGLEVRIPVRDKDVNEFTAKTQHVLRWFPPESYTPFGFTVQAIEYKSTYPEYATLDSYHLRQQPPIVLMGNVAYEISTLTLDSINAEVDFDATARVLQGLVLFANIGECTVSPSREQISADPKTKQWIKDRLQFIATQETSAFNTEVAAVKNPMAAARVYYTHHMKHGGRFMNSAPRFDGAFAPANRNAVHSLVINAKWFEEKNITFYALCSKQGGNSITPRRLTYSRDDRVPYWAVPCVIDKTTPRIRAMEEMRTKLDEICIKARKECNPYSHWIMNADPHVMLMDKATAEEFFKGEYIDLTGVAKKATASRAKGIAKGWSIHDNYKTAQPIPDNISSDAIGIVVRDNTHARQILNTLYSYAKLDWKMDSKADVWLVHPSPKAAVKALDLKPADAFYEFIEAQVDDPVFIASLEKYAVHYNSRFGILRAAINNGFFTPTDSVDVNGSANSFAPGYLSQVWQNLRASSLHTIMGISPDVTKRVHDKLRTLNERMEQRKHPVYDEFLAWELKHPAVYKLCDQLSKLSNSTLDPSIAAAIKETLL